MSAGEYTPEAAALYLAAIDRADRRARRARLLDLRAAAIPDGKAFADHFNGLKG